jgi:hypothetical protein
LLRAFLATLSWDLGDEDEAGLIAQGAEGKGHLWRRGSEVVVE